MAIKDIRQVHPYTVERDFRYKEAMLLYRKLLKALNEEYEEDIGMLVEPRENALYVTITYEIADKYTKRKGIEKMHNLIPEYLLESGILYSMTRPHQDLNCISFEIHDYKIPQTSPPTIADLDADLDDDFGYRQNPWGKVGAGILFVCEEDDTMLLMHRSGNVEEPFTWGVPGGAIIGEGWHDWHFDVEPYTDKELWEGAKRETWEECGDLPPHLSDTQIKHIFDFKKGDFVFRDFVVVITKEQKDNWDIDLEMAVDSWENNDFGWFSLNNLPHPLHMGVRFIFMHLGIDYED